MKIALLTPSLSRTAGGIFEIERRLAQTLGQLPDTTVDVYGAEDEHTKADLPLWRPLMPKSYPFIGPQNFRYSRSLRRAFLKCDADVAQLPALWMYTSVVLLAWARKYRRCYMVTINGMLERWALNNARVKKQIAAALFERRCLRGAACLQVNSEAELESVRRFGLRNPVCIIPNGVDIDQDPVSGEPMWKGGLSAGQKVLLYLGRLHPKKNLPELLRAWGRIADRPSVEPWQLVIAGWDQGGHLKSLRQLCRELALSRVLFIGPQFGDERVRTMQAADAFVLPSRSEGLPMSVLEAWAAAKPVVITRECNLPEGFTCAAAIETGLEAGSLAENLKKLTAMTDEERQRFGFNGRELVKERFSWPTVGRELRRVFEWVVSGGPAPKSVRTE